MVLIRILAAILFEMLISVTFQFVLFQLSECKFLNQHITPDSLNIQHSKSHKSLPPNTIKYH